VKHLLIGQNVLMGGQIQPFFRHAVHAADYSVSDREPQIVNNAFVVHLKRNPTFLSTEKRFPLRMPHGMYPSQAKINKFFRKANHLLILSIWPSPILAVA
jgi:hypothetical protein